MAAPMPPMPPPGRSNGGPPGPPEGVVPGALPLTGWRQTFTSLADNRDFSVLFGGNIGFFFGMNMMIILRGWLVEEKWENASYLGFIMATVAVPMLLLSPVAGVVTDRVDKRRLILVAQLLLVATNSVVAALIITDAIEFWHLLIVSMLSGTAFAFSMPGRQALVAMLVPREKMMNAVALSTAAMNSSRIIGPALAGVLVAPIGIGGAYIVSTLFYVAACAMTLALPAMPPQREREFTFVEDFVGGFSYIKGNAVLFALLLFATVPMIFAMPYMTLLPVFANRVWDIGPSGFGIMQAASGVGGLIGALVIANLDSYPHKARLLLAGALAFGAFVILLGLSPAFGLALVFLAAIGFGSMMLMTVNNTAIQLVIPDEMRGRVMSVMMMTFGLMPLGAVPAGVAAEAWGVQRVVVVGGLLCVGAVLALFTLLPALRSLDRHLEEGKARLAERATGPATRPVGVPVPAGERGA